MKKQTTKIAEENFLDEIDTHYSKIDKVLDNARMIQNEDYFVKFMSPIVISNFENHGVKLDLDSAKNINHHATQEYLYQFNNSKVW